MRILNKIIHGLKYKKWVFGVIVLVGALAVVGWSYLNNQKSICPKCNVILVSLDTLSALHLPCYGYERNTAPNLCAYADKNIFFTNSYSQSPITRDSHFSIFTSLYPHTHKMVNLSNYVLNEKYLTLAQILQRGSYQTIYHGALDTKQLPVNRGIVRGFGIVEGTSQIETWEERYKKLVNTKKMFPTFLFLHTYAVHGPYLTGHKKHMFTDLPEYPNIPLTAEEYKRTDLPGFYDLITKFIFDNAPKRIDKNVYSDLELARKINQTQDINLKRKYFDRLYFDTKGTIFGWLYSKSTINNDKDQIDYLKALYDEQIYNMDREFAKLVKFLDDTKLSENTILIVTSDHGEEFMEHQSVGHGINLHTTSTKVPLIIHVPGINHKKINDLVQGIDIYPTVLSLVGLTPQSVIEGIDLSGIIKGDENPRSNNYLLSEFGGIVGINANNWRFYYDNNIKSPKGLYDLALDPLEQNNLLKKKPEKNTEFLNLLKTLKKPGT